MVLKLFVLRGNEFRIHVPSECLTHAAASSEEAEKANAFGVQPE